MKAAKRCLSSAEVNPHQALAAYNSLAMTTLRQPNHNPKPNPTLNLNPSPNPDPRHYHQRW